MRESRRARILVALCVAGLLAFPAAAADRHFEVLDLRPSDGPVGWGLRNVFAPLTGLFLGGPGYWYAERELDVQTTPPGALLDLFYIRANFQKRFEQAESPVTVLLPPRIEAGPRDAVTVRASLAGYRSESVTLKATSRESDLVIELLPLPNRLVSVAHSYFAGRTSLSFLTEEQLTFRLQELDEGFAVILTETASSPEAASAIEGTRSPVIEEMVAQQLGEDLVVRVVLTEKARESDLETRSRAAHDAARDLYRFSLDIAPRDGRNDMVTRTLAALGRLRPGDVRGCALRFDRALREGLDPGDLSRALTPSGSFTDPFLRAAMRRLGELSEGGSVSFTDGARYRPSVPIELEAAMSQAAGAQGYLALLRGLVTELEGREHQREMLRSLIAPELPRDRFDAIVEAAAQRERDCLARR